MRIELFESEREEGRMKGEEERAWYVPLLKHKWTEVTGNVVASCVAALCAVRLVNRLKRTSNTKETEFEGIVDYRNM